MRGSRATRRVVCIGRGESGDVRLKDPLQAQSKRHNRNARCRRCCSVRILDQQPWILRDLARVAAECAKCLETGRFLAVGSGRCHPRPRFALSGCDFDVGHQSGDFPAQRDGVDSALERGQIEPLVCGDEIDQAVAPARIDHAEVEQDVPVRRSLDRQRCAGVDRSLKHPGSPISRRGERGSCRNLFDATVFPGAYSAKPVFQFCGIRVRRLPACWNDMTRKI